MSDDKIREQNVAELRSLPGVVRAEYETDNDFIRLDFDDGSGYAVRCNSIIQVVRICPPDP